MGKIILCLDDQPDKYRCLRKLLFDKKIVMVTTCRYQDFMEYLNGPDQIVGICLDFNMPFGTGAFFAKYLVGKQIPIIITDLDKNDVLRIIQRLIDIKYDINLNKGLPDRIDWDLGPPKNLYDLLQKSCLIKALPTTQEGWEIEAINFWKLDYSEYFYPV